MRIKYIIKRTLHFTVENIKFRIVLPVLFFYLLSFQMTFSQNYPIQVVTEIIPPYSVYLSDYTSAQYDMLKVNIYVIDNNLVDYRAKLKMIIEGQNITIETDPNQAPPPLLLQGGVPEMLYGSDLDWYFNPDHLIFKGLNKYDFLRTGKLPEGLYRFSFKVVDYNRNTTVSNTGFSLAWLILNDPPVINTPYKDQKVDIIEPQQIIFQWTPRHTEVRIHPFRQNITLNYMKCGMKMWI